jgi:hypothetical protein
MFYTLPGIGTHIKILRTFASVQILTFLKKNTARQATGYFRICFFLHMKITQHVSRYVSPMSNQVYLIRFCISTIFLIGAMTLSTPATVQAQFSFGIGGGLNYAALADVDFGSAQSTYDNRSGYHIGVFIDLNAGLLALRPGVYYLNAGALFENGIPDPTSLIGIPGVGGIPETTPDLTTLDDIRDDFELKFIVVPIDVRLRMNVPVIQPYLFIGPELRFRSDDIDQETTEILDLRSFNLAGNLGVGLELNLGGYRLMPEFRYAFDISGITGDQFMVGDVAFTADDDHKSRGFMLRLGLVF